tara:strand:- start:266 stop:526 length:261 start_codon:yes stop_codon:yes gene_type:complete
MEAKIREQEDIKQEITDEIEKLREYRIINARIELYTSDIQLAHLRNIEEEKLYSERLTSQLDDCNKLLKEEQEKFQKASEDYMKLR